jgi:hypothetical protein
MPDITDKQCVEIGELVSSREKFNDFVYTPLNEALINLAARKSDKKLLARTYSLFDLNLPDPFLSGKPRAVLFRHVATPNYETRRFLNLLRDHPELEPLIFEVRNDKFTSNNKLKHYLGRMGFYHGLNGKDESIISKKTIVDFASYDGKPINEVKTTWGQDLIDFHHGLFDNRIHIEKSIYNLSDHLPDAKGDDLKAPQYYRHVLTLATSHAILFENFLLEDKEELHFIKSVFLPIFIETYAITGYKPLIVPLEPTDIEGEDFWLCHPPEIKELLGTN